MAMVFDGARMLYPGIKRGLTTEYKNFRSKYKQECASLIPLLVPAIKKQIAYKLHLKRTTEKTWPWKHFQTWINQRVWEAEIPAMKSAVKIERCNCGKNLNSGERQDGICMECKFKAAQPQKEVKE